MTSVTAHYLGWTRGRGRPPTGRLVGAPQPPRLEAVAIAPIRAPDAVVRLMLREGGAGKLHDACGSEEQVERIYLPACRYTAWPVAGCIQRSVSTARARSESANTALVVSALGGRFCASGRLLRCVAVRGTSWQQVPEPGLWVTSN